MLPLTIPAPEAFAAALEALVAEYGHKLNDNEVITALERQLTRAWADACEPQPPGLFAAAPELLVRLKEACDQIAELSHYANNHGGMIDEQEFVEGRAAIAKAEAA